MHCQTTRALRAFYCLQPLKSILVDRKKSTKNSLTWTPAARAESSPKISCEQKNCKSSDVDLLISISRWKFYWQESVDARLPGDQ